MAGVASVKPGVEILSRSRGPSGYTASPALLAILGLLDALPGRVCTR